MTHKKDTICIVCRKALRHDPSFLFCKPCSQKGIFIKLKAFRKTWEFKKGMWLGNQHAGRLPTIEERKML